MFKMLDKKMLKMLELQDNVRNARKCKSGDQVTATKAEHKRLLCFGEYEQTGHHRVGQRSRFSVFCEKVI